MVIHVEKNYAMEQLPTSVLVAIGVLLMSLVTYFLKKRDSSIDKMSVERKEVDTVLNAKIDKVLDTVNGISTRLTRIEEKQTSVNKDMVRLEKNGVERSVKIEKILLELNKIDREVLQLIEWKKHTQNK